jgi:hypothetical protein
VTSSDGQPVITETLSDLGTGTAVLGKLKIALVPGKESGKFVVTLNYE